LKLIVAIVGRDDAAPVVGALIAEGMSATMIEARGGFLREGVAALLIGLDDRHVGRALTILARHCRTRRAIVPDEMPYAFRETVLPEVVTVEVGGATAFVLPVERFERF
jgi:uncharacterized protein YaaQ